MQSIKQYVFVFFVLFYLLACSDQLNAQTYSETGVSLTIPEQWKFTNDSYYKGNRTISLLTGEFSGVTLTIFPEGDPDYKDIDRNDFVDKRIINILTFGLNKSKFIEKRKSITRQPFSGEHVSISYTIPDRSEIEIESYLLTFDKAKIIVIIDTEKVDLHKVSNKIQGFLKSISYNSKLSNFDKNKVY